jgi:aspartokinase-like uncharacterized kinase
VVVLKVGGSLLGWPGLPGRLRAYLDGHADERIVLLGGGGAWADSLRALDSAHGIGEKRSHRLALRVLDLTAHLVADLVPGVEVVEGPEGLEGAWNRGTVPVLAALRLLESRDGASLAPLPESWDVTSDSIAARVAVLLNADRLRLAKSVGLGRCSGRHEAARAGLVDPYFPEASRPFRSVTVVNLRADPPTEEEMD